MSNLITVSQFGVVKTDSLVITEEFGREHHNVMKALEKLIADGTLGDVDFNATSYIDRSNRKNKMYELTERGFLIAMPFIGGRKAKEGQVRLVDAFLDAQKRICEPVPATEPRLVAKTVVAESAARMLRMSDTSKVRMLGKICEEEGLSTAFLPNYSDERLTMALGDLLKRHNAGMSAIKANLILIAVGYLEELERRASKGETKRFKSITNAGLKYGKNETSKQNSNQTQPRWYVHSFADLLKEINEWIVSQGGVA